MKGLLYMKRNKVLIAALAIVLVALSFGGFKYMQTLPQVKPEEAVQNLSLYSAEVEDLYNELNEEFEINSKGVSIDEWQNFSSEWMVKANNIKPEILKKRMEEKYGNFEDFITSTNKEVIDLWNIYNRYMNASEKNRPSYEDRIYDQKESIEKKLANIKEVIK